MPAISAANLTRLRTTRHATRLGLVVYAPPIIWSARVNGDQSQGAQSITVDGVTTNYFAPAHAPAKNFLMGFSAVGVGGYEVGMALFKSYGAPTLAVGVHNVELADDLYITVWEVVPPWTIPYSIDDSDVITEDGNVAYTDENETFMPLARCGTHAVIYLDPATGLATGKFYDRSVAFEGATIASYAWTFRGGTPATSAVAGTAAVPIEVTWNAVGNYYCSLTVTDSEGKTHTRWFVVFVRKEYEATLANAVPYVPGGTGTLPYRQIEVRNAEESAEQGVWNASVRVYTDADVDKFPERALVVFFADDWYGDEKVSIGNETWRENIRLVGYITSGTVIRNTIDGYVEFDIASVSGFMQDMLAFEGWLETAAAPDAWHEVAGLTFNLAVHHLLTQHSTISQVTDVYLNLPAYAAEYIDLAGDTLGDQLRGIISAVRGEMGCNAQGHLYFVANPQLLPVDERSTTYVIDTESADFRDLIDFGEIRQRKDVSQVVFTGETSAGDVYFSIAPGLPWLTGKPRNVEGIQVTTQDEANEFAGLFEGFFNSNYREVEMRWRGNYSFWDIFPREPFQATVTAAQNRRDIVWTDRRCWTRRVSWTYTAGVMLYDTVIERDTAYLDGDTDDGGEGGGTGGYSPQIPVPPGGLVPVGTYSPQWPGTIPTSTIPVPTIPSPTLPQPYEAYDASGGYVGSFATTIAQAIGLPNGATWNHYFVTVTGAVAWTIALNGATIAAGTGTATGTLATPATFVAGSGVVFTIAGGGSTLFWGIGV